MKSAADKNCSRKITFAINYLKSNSIVIMHNIAIKKSS